jgi:ABC-type amino acid transport substrate-binding protein
MSDIITITPGILTVGTYAAFEPVCWRDGDTARGKDIDFLEAFADRLGLQLSVHFFTFANIWQRPARGELDIAAAGIAPLSSRTTPGVVWSEPYFLVQRSLLVRAADTARFQTMNDFAGRTIAVTRGSTADIDTMERKPASTRVVYYESQRVAIHDLLNGTIDAFAEGDVCAKHFAGLDSEHLAVVDVHQMEIPETFVFAVREVSNLLDPLNAFIGEQGASY